MAATVFLFDKPNSQMIVHQGLTMATLVYLVQDQRMFTSRFQKVIEIASEFLLLLMSILMQQCMVYSDQTDIERGTFTAMGLILTVNITFLIYTVVQNCKEKKRLKAISQAKKEWEQAAAELKVEEEQREKSRQELAKVVRESLLVPSTISIEEKEQKIGRPPYCSDSESNRSHNPCH